MNEVKAEAKQVVEVILMGQGSSVSAKLRDGTIILPKDVGFFPHPSSKPYYRYSKSGKSKQRGAKQQKQPKQPKTVAFKDTSGYEPNTVAERLVKTLGSNTVAALLGVSADRPGRWASGAEEPSPESRSALTDLDSLVGHLLNAFTPEQAPLWLNGQDPYLGARPIDVFRIDGAGPVIEAIEAFEQGAFA